MTLWGLDPNSTGILDRQTNTNIKKGGLYSLDPYSNGILDRHMDVEFFKSLDES